MEKIREQMRTIARKRDMLLMKVQELENFFSSPEAARLKHGMSPPSELRAFQRSSKIQRTPQRNKATSSTAPEKVAKIVPENTELPEDPVEDSIIAPEEQLVTTAEKPICVVDGVGPGFQDHIPFATELHRVCKEAVAINIRKLSKGGWLVVFKDHEKFKDPWVWAQKPFGGSANAHPPSEKRITPDKPYPLKSC